MSLTAFYVRLHHTGVFGDGRPNTGPVQITDLDVGYENQNRKVPVYVPYGGHIDVPLSSRSMLSLADGAIAKFVEAGLLQANLFFALRNVGDLAGRVSESISIR